MIISPIRTTHHITIGDPIYPADVFGDTYKIDIGTTDEGVCYVEYNDCDMERHYVTVPSVPHLSEPEWLNSAVAYFLRAAGFRGFAFNEMGKHILLDAVRSYADTLNNKKENKLMINDENKNPTLEEWQTVAVEAKAGRYPDGRAWWNAFERPYQPDTMDVIRTYMHRMGGLFERMENSDVPQFSATRGMCGDWNVWAEELKGERLLTVDHSDDAITVTHWDGQVMMATKHIVIKGPSAGKLMVCDISKGETSVSSFVLPESDSTPTLLAMTILDGVQTTPALTQLHMVLLGLIG